MNPDTEQQLKQDAKAIQAQAVARLDDRDFSQELLSTLSQQPPQAVQSKQRHWFFAMAAAVSLTCMAWLSWQGSEMNPQTNPAIQSVAESFQLNLNQYPQSVEQTLNQPLVQEQQAIIDDLKTLKEQLLSI